MHVFGYNFPTNCIVQNFVFLMFKGEMSNECVSIMCLTGLCYFICRGNSDSYKVFIDSTDIVLSVTHFIIIKYIVWYRNKPVILLKRLKNDLCRSNFDFLKIKYVLERYTTSNNFLKCRLYVQIPMS